ncbi:MAG TPA: vitamin K epoxide reductase family protein, partial [Candidatus Sulfotelmatobacter sp.]|nr:vitamin K epoxide reductase family protein [Candidatus Sulfotelmatobacter sp.]
MSPESAVTRKPSGPSRLGLWAGAALTLAGIGVSSYLSAKRFTGGSLVCSRWAQCDTVNNSVYAVMYGIPVAFIGLAGYLVLFALALAALTSDGTIQRRIALLSFLLA